MTTNDKKVIYMVVKNVKLDQVEEYKYLGLW